MYRIDIPHGNLLQPEKIKTQLENEQVSRSAAASSETHVCCLSCAEIGSRPSNHHGSDSAYIWKLLWEPRALKPTLFPLHVLEVHIENKVSDLGSQSLVEGSVMHMSVFNLAFGEDAKLRAQSVGPAPILSAT